MAHLAEKMRTLADGMQTAIEHARRPLSQNPTPKRNAEYYSRLHDAANMERTQRAMQAIADAAEVGALPDILAPFKTKAAIAPLVYKGLKGGGYYDRIPDDEYRDKSAAAKCLQEMIDSKATPAEHAERLSLQRISVAESKIALLDIASYFPTPKPVIADMVALADLQTGHVVLEPSAGSGRIAEYILALGIDLTVHLVECNYSLRELLTLKKLNLVGQDFMEYTPTVLYDRIIMNPPFEKLADYHHISRAFGFLKPGGRIVSVCGNGPRSQEKIRPLADRWIDLESGAFKESGTGVNAAIVVINRGA
jgi:protein-L-isoaspartate O-methyltransferase